MIEIALVPLVLVLVVLVPSVPILSRIESKDAQCRAVVARARDR